MRRPDGVARTGSGRGGERETDGDHDPQRHGAAAAHATEPNRRTRNQAERGHAPRRRRRRRARKGRRLRREDHECLERQRSEAGQHGGGGSRDLRHRCRDEAHPHDRRDERCREDVGRQRDERGLSEGRGDQRRGRECGGDGHGDRVGERPRQSAVPEPVAQARSEGQEAQHRGEGQAPARVAARPRVEREGRGGRQQDRVPPRRRPTGERGDETGSTHHPGSLDRRTAAGQRDVDDDQRECGHDAPRPRDPGSASQEEHEGREQHHVLSAGGGQVRQP